MNPRRLWLAFVTGALVAAAAGPKPTPAPAPASTSASKRIVVPFELFFHELRSRGMWVRLDDGRWAWGPDGVGRDWRPFGRGTWAFTNVGWYWLSEEPWGWATSHYGRWEWREKGGWVWLPDRDWSPAWAAWRQGDVGIGWHPLLARSESGSGGGTIGASEVGFRTEGWTFLLWRDVSRALIPRSSTPGGQRGMNTLEALVASSATAVAATAEFLSQTRNVTRIEKRDDAANNPGPERALVEAKTGRRLVACRIVDSSEPRELLIVARDETVVLAFRPGIKENSDEIQQFISRQADRYRAVQERKSK